MCFFVCGDLEFWSVVEKLQMTVACDIQKGFANTTKVCWLIAIAVLQACPPKKRKKSNNKYTY